MSGSINVAARFGNGETICLDAWTNFLPEMILNATTLSGDDTIVRRMLREAATEEGYAGPQPFRRSGYGIVVIDFVGRRIHSMQGYTSFSRIMASELLDKQASNRRDRPFKAVLSQDAEGLLDAGRLSHVADGPDEIEPVRLDRTSGLELAGSDYETWRCAHRHLFPIVSIDVSPFVLFDHPEDAPLTAMKADLGGVGFPMRAADGLHAMYREGRLP